MERSKRNRSPVTNPAEASAGAVEAWWGTWSEYSDTTGPHDLNKRRVGWVCHEGQTLATFLSRYYRAEAASGFPIAFISGRVGLGRKMAVLHLTRADARPPDLSARHSMFRFGACFDHQTATCFAQNCALLGRADWYVKWIRSQLDQSKNDPTFSVNSEGKIVVHQSFDSVNHEAHLSFFVNLWGLGYTDIVVKLFVNHYVRSPPNPLLLTIAARRGHVGFLKILCKQLPPQLDDRQSRDLLQAAIESQDVETLRFMLDFTKVDVTTTGMFINAAVIPRNGALPTASIPIAMLLVDAGAPVHRAAVNQGSLPQGEDPPLALHYAIFKRDLKMIEYLISVWPADVEGPDLVDETQGIGPPYPGMDETLDWLRGVGLLAQ